MAYWPDVNKGDRITRPALLENNVRHLLNRQDGLSAAVTRTQAMDAATILVYNATNAMLAEGSPVAIDGTQAMAEDAFAVKLVSDASKPYAILKDTIEKDEIGEAIVLGVARVKLSGNGTGDYAEPNTSEQTFKRADSGAARILWSGSGEAVICLGGTENGVGGTYDGPFAVSIGSGGGEAAPTALAPETIPSGYALQHTIGNGEGFLYLRQRAIGLKAAPSGSGLLKWGAKGFGIQETTLCSEYDYGQDDPSSSSSESSSSESSSSESSSSNSSESSSGESSSESESSSSSPSVADESETYAIHVNGGHLVVGGTQRFEIAEKTFAIATSSEIWLEFNGTSAQLRFGVYLPENGVYAARIGHVAISEAGASITQYQYGDIMAPHSKTQIAAIIYSMAAGLQLTIS